jgi:hypothetical protein
MMLSSCHGIAAGLSIATGYSLGTAKCRRAFFGWLVLPARWLGS